MRKRNFVSLLLVLAVIPFAVNIIVSGEEYSTTMIGPYTSTMLYVHNDTTFTSLWTFSSTSYLNYSAGIGSGGGNWITLTTSDTLIVPLTITQTASPHWDLLLIGLAFGIGVTFGATLVTQRIKRTLKERGLEHL